VKLGREGAGGGGASGFRLTKPFGGNFERRAGKRDGGRGGCDSTIYIA